MALLLAVARCVDDDEDRRHAEPVGARVTMVKNHMPHASVIKEMMAQPTSPNRRGFVRMCARRERRARKVFHSTQVTQPNCCLRAFNVVVIVDRQPLGLRTILQGGTSTQHGCTQLQYAKRTTHHLNEHMLFHPRPAREGRHSRIPGN